MRIRFKADLSCIENYAFRHMRATQSRLDHLRSSANPVSSAIALLQKFKKNPPWKEVWK